MKEQSINEPIKAVLIGAGRRGIDVFGKFAEENPHLLKFVAVVDLNYNNLNFFGEKHNIPLEKRFSQLNEFVAKKEECNVAINATSDQSHFTTTKTLLENDFHVLLEKPIATTLEHCQELERISLEKNKLLMICHVLRYSEFFKKIKELINDNSIGEIKSIFLIEDIGKEHFAHSYVRGNWNNSLTSGPISLTKTCHDFDIITWLLNYKKCQFLTSFSPELHFQEKNSPGKTPNYCIDSCDFKDSCNFYAQKVYLSPDTKPRRRRAVAISMKDEDILTNLSETKYGKCVYKCNNNVPDTQITTMSFGDNVNATLIMAADEEEGTRKIEIKGEKGKIFGSLIKGELWLEVKNQPKIKIDIKTKGDHHGGGDFKLIKDFLDAVKNIENENRTKIKESMLSHELAFQAEKSRQTFKRYDMI